MLQKASYELSHAKLKCTYWMRNGPVLFLRYIIILSRLAVLVNQKLNLVHLNDLKVITQRSCTENTELLNRFTTLVNPSGTLGKFKL